MIGWLSNADIAREQTITRAAAGMGGPLKDKRDADEWQIRRRITKRWRRWSKLGLKNLAKNEKAQR